jgi:hypothetical protein
MRSNALPSLLPSAALASLLVLGIGCESKAPPGASDSEATTLTESATAELPTSEPSEPAPDDTKASPDEADIEPEAPVEEPPWPGPFLAITQSSVGFYEDTSFEREGKIGYGQNGALVPVHPEKITKGNCTSGWYRLAAGGYVCANHGTLDLNSPEVKFARKQPNLEEILPYVYARNAKNGTPLYKSVPTPEQMLVYEPYLAGDAKKSGDAKKAAPKATKPTTDSKQSPPSTEDTPANESPPSPAEPRAESPSEQGSSSPGSSDAGAPKKPWWQDEKIDDRLHEVRLDDLAAEADDLIAKRMVKGFYVAVDKQFSWNKRPWYKTTKGLVAPADRFWTTKGSTFQGVELAADVQLPIGWSHGWRKNRPKYELGADGKTMKLSGQLSKFDWLNLTGRELEVGGSTYVESVDGFWVRTAHIRITKPGPPPADLGPTERWIDVNLSTQTLVAFEGARPVYATLISSGKEHKDKARDHRTPAGEFRVREKHITGTMDGDGSAAGDLPYSIEDVPYVMYFHRAYAIHGAFWHENYGTQMSHGCVNLAPLDAKWVFFFADPPVPDGWHGAWSSESRPGTRVVVHD